MTEQINQDEINKALWAACDTFRGTVSADTYKDFILTMLFLKYISDVWQDHYDNYQAQYGDEPELIDEMMKNERFVLPKESSFYTCMNTATSRAMAPASIWRCMRSKRPMAPSSRMRARACFRTSRSIPTSSVKRSRRTPLRHLLEDFAKEALNLKPSRVGSLDVIGGGTNT